VPTRPMSPRHQASRRSGRAGSACGAHAARGTACGDLRREGGARAGDPRGTRQGAGCSGRSRSRNRRRSDAAGAAASDRCDSGRQSRPPQVLELDEKVRRGHKACPSHACVEPLLWKGPPNQVGGEPWLAECSIRRLSTWKVHRIKLVASRGWRNARHAGTAPGGSADSSWR
jgi:hypothetical protein